MGASQTSDKFVNLTEQRRLDKLSVWNWDIIHENNTDSKNTALIHLLSQR